MPGPEDLKKAQREKCAQNFKLLKETDLDAFIAEDIEELRLKTGLFIKAINEYITEKKNDHEKDAREKVYVSYGTSANVASRLSKIDSTINNDNIVAVTKIINKIFITHGYAIPEDAICKQDSQPITDLRPIAEVVDPKKANTQAGHIFEADQEKED